MAAPQGAVHADSPLRSLLRDWPWEGASHRTVGTPQKEREYGQCHARMGQTSHNRHMKDGHTILQQQNF